MKKINEKLKQRNNQIKTMKDTGATLQEMSIEFGISRERVRQILKGMGEVAIRKYKKRSVGDRWTPEFRKQYERGRHIRNRELAISVLGGKCASCGMNDKRCLQIDHINGGGTKELRDIGSYAICRWIRGNPEEAKTKYQILCANCNWIKKYENKNGEGGGRRAYKNLP